MTHLTRRQLLTNAGTGFGLLALADLMASAEQPSAGPLPIRKPHLAPKAKRCIFLFMPGGPSQLDLFDPKPKLAELNGKPLPFDKPKLERTKTGNLFASPWKFAKHGKSGIEVSELLPHIAKTVDDLCVVRSMVADNINHTGAALQMNTGEQAFSRPSLGSWLSYGLGAENQNLPGFVVIAPEPPFQGSPLWSSSFLPGEHQGTWVRDPANPLADVKPTGDIVAQRAKLDLLRELNESHKQDRSNGTALDARISSFELAFRMQSAAPEAFDLSREPSKVRAMYGLDEKPTEVFGRQCLLARRLVERGVRFVQVYDTGTGGWDHHGDIRKQLPARCQGIDKPIAGLLADLKARGLLDDTLVVWGSEFGRTPTAEGGDGREHHPFGFTMFLAGGGIKGGMTHGATDEFGWHAVENKVHVHDLHATILHLMGLDHTKLTYRYGGRDYRLTDVHGEVVKAVLA